MDWFLTLEQQQIMRLVRTSAVLYPLLSAAHILGFSLLSGAIIAFDVRLLSILPGPSWQSLQPLLLRLARFGFILAFTTGTFLFSLRATDYIENPAFVFKAALLFLSLINVLVFHWVKLSNTNTQRHLKWLAGFSIMLWVSIILAGRWIGFV